MQKMEDLLNLLVSKYNYDKNLLNGFIKIEINIKIDQKPHPNFEIALNWILCYLASVNPISLHENISLKTFASQTMSDIIAACQHWK